jgi:hypothetical protein
MGEGRQFLDSFGFSWEAVEITREMPRIDQPAPADGWLYFLSRGTTRRLRAYPTDWRTLEWADLEDLCTRAEVVGTDAGSRPVRALSEGSRAVTAR